MTVFITGVAGFIGFHLADLLLRQGHEVHGYDGVTNYYDIALKRARLRLLDRYPRFKMTEAFIEHEASLSAAVARANPRVIVHLAAQAGVRYSLENPRAYVESNIIGTFNVLECARHQKIQHLLIASTSSVYGANVELPYREDHKADEQLSFYAATKKSNESMAHAYSHLHGIPTTVFRFFTVYGPWGRPDMALFKFTKAIINDTPIDIYNHGDMWRDFTYVTDLVHGVQLLMGVVPPGPQDSLHKPVNGDSLSPVAPYRVVNVGNSEKVRLLDFVETIEVCLGKQAIRNYMEIQAGDVPATWADATLLEQLTGYRPQTSFKDGVRHFIDWYRQYHSV
jgi:UDP-glucuronate 4-epimerase